MIFGIRAVIEAILAEKEIDKILVKRDLQSDLSKELFDALKGREIAVQRVPAERLDRVTRKNHQGVIAFIPAISYQKLEDIIPFLIVMALSLVGAIFNKKKKPNRPIPGVGSPDSDDDFMGWLNRIAQQDEEPEQDAEQSQRERARERVGDHEPRREGEAVHQQERDPSQRVEQERERDPHAASGSLGKEAYLRAQRETM